MCFLFPFIFDHLKKKTQKNFVFFSTFFFSSKVFFLALFKPDVLVEIDLPLANQTSEVLIHAQSQREDYPVGFIPKRPWAEMAHVLYECDMKTLVQNGKPQKGCKHLIFPFLSSCSPSFCFAVAPPSLNFNI